MLKHMKKILTGRPDLNDSNIKRLLIKLSIPAMIGVFVNNFYNIMDTIFVGKGVGADAIGALTIAFPMQILMTAFIMMVATGGMSVLSRSLGEQNKEKASKCFGNSIFLAIIISTVIMVVGLIFLEPILYLLGGRGDILILSIDYVRIILFGTMFMSLAYVFSELLRAEGKAKESMGVMLVGAFSNIILDYIFVIVIAGGVKGAALATVLANVISFSYGLFYLVKGDSVLKIEIRYFILETKLVKEILSVGVSSLISQGAGSISLAIANATIVNVGGDILINSIGLFNRIHSIIFMPIFGVIQGMQPILGYNYGAKRIKKVIETANITLKYVFMIALINTIIVLIFTRPLVSLFIDDIELINYCVPYIRLSILFACVGAWQSTGGSVFRAVGMAKKAFFFSLLRQIIIFVPSMIIFSYLIGPLGCWLSYGFSDLLSGIISLKYIKNFLKKLGTTTDEVLDSTIIDM